MVKYVDSSLFNMSIVENILRDSITVKEKIMNDDRLKEFILKSALVIAKTFMKGGKILICGNGGSASEALHLCCEMLGRFQKERRPVPAISLNADVATMTAIGNDYGYDIIFEREVEAFMDSRDIFIGISTSGNSENVLRAARMAKAIGGTTIAFLGKSGGKIKDEVDIPIIVPCNITARIQESHICITHIICDLVERTLELNF